MINKLKKPKKISRKLLVKKLDKAVSLLVIKRDGACVICGSTQKLGNGHLFSRIAYSTRWDLKNSNCQCWGCNYKHEYDTYPYMTWFRKKYGSWELDELHRKYVTPRKFKDFELEELLRTLTEECIHGVYGNCLRCDPELEIK